MKIDRERYLDLRKYIEENPILDTKLVEEISIIDFSEKIGSLDFDNVEGTDMYFGVDFINLTKNTLIWAVFPFATYGIISEFDIKQAYSKLNEDIEIRYLEDEGDCSVMIELKENYTNKEICRFIEFMMRLNTEICKIVSDRTVWTA